MSKQPWTAHNIRLGQGFTIPNAPDFLSCDARLAAILRTLSAFYREGLENLHVADLGALEGGYSLALAMRGAHTTGIEAREQNLEKCRLVKEHFNLPNLQFVKDDVKNFGVENYGEFNIVLALGIAYHLDNPVQWLQQIAHTVKDMLFIDTHYAPSDAPALPLLRPSLQHLGELESVTFDNQNFSGRWFFEYDENTDAESQLWASYSNNKSFWLTKESLLLAIQHAGFDLIFEQHDYSLPKYKILTTEYPRTFLVAVKKDAFI
jgi:hypothetical protein